MVDCCRDTDVSVAGRQVKICYCKILYRHRWRTKTMIWQHLEWLLYFHCALAAIVGYWINRYTLF